MKNNSIGMAKRIFVFFGSLLVFSLAACLYLGLGTNGTESSVGKSESGVPYKAEPCENACLVLTVPDGSAVMLYLDFLKDECRAAVLESYVEGDEKRLGYNADFTLELGFDEIGGIVDRIGGIELYGEGEYLRFTGVQVVDIISDAKITPELYREILSAIFDGIARAGFSSADFVYLLESCKTDMTMPDCYDWQENMQTIFSNTVILN